MRIGVLGAGSYGSALGKVLRENRNSVKFFDPYKYPAIGLEQVLRWAEVIVLATPADAASALVKQMPDFAFEKPLIVTTKGVMSLGFWEKFKYFEIVSGPGFSDDIVNKKRTKLTVAARGATSGETLSEDLLSTSYLKFDKTEDLLGTALLSGLKNIYAIEAGRRGLALGSSEFKEYIANAAKEAERFLLFNGGFVETVRLSAGLGDFVLTCGSEKSRNYQFGMLLGGRRRVLERKRLVKKFLRETTVEGTFAISEIDRRGLFVPKDDEILTDIIRRVKNATKR